MKPQASTGMLSGQPEGTANNPLAGNALTTRADLQRAVIALWHPVANRLSQGGARARLGHTSAQYPDAVAELEGFARPLWGLVPLAVGGGDVDWEPVLRGLAAGTDPDHTEYWGRAGVRCQRLVEMAPIGFALALIPEQIWDPLEPRVRDNLASWLSDINLVMNANSNWLFFQVLVNEGLRRVGAKGFNNEAQAAALEKLESYYVSDGWYSDGPKPQLDYYIPWAMHFYGLIYACAAADRDPARAQRFKERAAEFAPDFAHWFADDGSALPFGRSLTYRFAQGSFWGALAYADVEALPWDQVKGLAFRHLRWWAQQPIFDHPGLLTIGYRYPNLNIAEQYNAPGSPYWAMKFFLPLALPETHPLWRADEAPPAELKLKPVLEQPHAGLIVIRDAATGHVSALATGQDASWARHGVPKYSKFAYSTAFGFSVPASDYGLKDAAADSMLALSDDNVHWRVREGLVDWRLDGGGLWSRWRPWPHVEVETWLLPHGSWHVRVHRICSERPLFAAEGGFALDRTGDDPSDLKGSEYAGIGYAHASYPAGASGIRDLDGRRHGENIRVGPNTNLLYSRTVLPTLLAEHDPGEHWLTGAVLASTDQAQWSQAWDVPPAINDIRTAVTALGGETEVRSQTPECGHCTGG